MDLGGAALPMHAKPVSTNISSPDYIPSHAACISAAQFVEDAIYGRTPDIARAVRAGLAEGGNQAGSAANKGKMGSVDIVRAFLFSSLWFWFLQLVIMVHCALAFLEYVPGGQTPPGIRTPVEPAVMAVEGFCLSVYLLDQVATLYALGWRHYLDKKWEGVFLLVTLLGGLDWVLFYLAGLTAMYRFSRMFRPLLSLTKVPVLRRLLSSILWTLPHIAQITVIVAVLCAFYGVLGMQLFSAEQVPNYGPWNDNFDTFPAAILGIFVLTTTENWPSIGYPAFKSRPYVGILFFCSALFIFLFLVTPVILAIVYEHYQNVQKVLAQNIKAKSHVSLVFAYSTLMNGDGSVDMHFDAFATFLPYVKPGITRKQASVLFAVLDVNGSRNISIAEFLRLLTVLELDIEEIAVRDDQAAADSAASLTMQLLKPIAWACGVDTRPAVSSSPHLQSSGAMSSRSGAVQLRTVQDVAGDLIETRAFKVFAWICTLGASACTTTWSVDAQKAYDECMCISFPDLQDDDNLGPLPVWPSDSGVAGSATASSTVGSWWGATGGSLGGGEGQCGVGCSSSIIVISEGLALVFLAGSMIELWMRAQSYIVPPAPPTGARWRISNYLPRWWAFSNFWNAVDAFIVVWAFFSSIALLAGAHDHLSLAVADIFEASRAFRFIRILTLWPMTRSLLSTVGTVMPLMGQIMAVYLSLMYAFSLLGQVLFSTVNPNNPGSPFPPSPGGLCQDCNAWYFGELPYALMASLQMTVGNNWNSIMYPNLQGMASLWGGIYFVVYRFIMMDVLTAIIESLMLDMYEKKQAASDTAAMESRMARALAQRLGVAKSQKGGSSGRLGSLARSGSGTNSDGADTEATQQAEQFTLRARADLLEELTAVEDSVSKARASGLTPAGRRSSVSSLGGGGGAGGRGAAYTAAVYGLSAQDLEVLEKTLRALESTLLTKE